MDNLELTPQELVDKILPSILSNFEIVLKDKNMIERYFILNDVLIKESIIDSEYSESFSEEFMLIFRLKVMNYFIKDLEQLEFHVNSLIALHEK